MIEFTFKKWQIIQGQSVALLIVSPKQSWLPQNIGKACGAYGWPKGWMYNLTNGQSNA